MRLDCARHADRLAIACGEVGLWRAPVGEVGDRLAGVVRHLQSAADSASAARQPA
ncbi:hypothetical protein APY03_5699 [Variovorax sp. WDL1]|nr:hypothetical protein APY03_5699 [Variovorax sp. WDL1]